MSNNLITTSEAELISKGLEIEFARVRSAVGALEVRQKLSSLVLEFDVVVRDWHVTIPWLSP
jgi:hypothetical protein